MNATQGTNNGDPTLQQIVDPPQGVFVSQQHDTVETTEAGDDDYRIETLNWKDGGEGVESNYWVSDWDQSLEWGSVYERPATSWPEAWPDWVWEQGLGDETNPPGIGAPDISAPGHYDEQPGWNNDTTSLIEASGDTEMKLATGGPNGSRQMNLWCLTASASDMDTDKAIPPEQISIGGLGNLDTNGQLWVVLSDNDPVVVTPDGHRKNYTFGVGATKYHSYIGLTTSTTNANLDTNVPEVCVGQTVTMGLDWQVSGGLGGIPPFTNVDNIYWHLPDKYVNQQTNYSSTCTTYVRDDDLLTNLVQQCWYVNLPGGACSVRETLRFANGQSVNIAAAGSFTVYRPQKVSENMNQDFLNPNVNIPSPPLYATNVNGSLELGDSQGGYARFWAEYKSAYPGGFQEAQIVQSYFKCGNDNPVDSGSQWWGDGAGNKAGSFSTVSSAPGIAYAMQTDKYPSVPLIAPQTVVNQVFKTYFQFKPAGDGIWVTMGRVNWSWAATSTYTDGQWNPPSGTTVSDPQYHDDDSFPLWDDVTSNHLNY